MIGLNITATVLKHGGSPETVQLLDNGAGTTLFSAFVICICVIVNINMFNILPFITCIMKRAFFYHLLNVEFE